MDPSHTVKRPKHKPPLGLADLCGWTVGLGLLAVIWKATGTGAAAIFVGSFAAAIYLDRRFSLQFHDKYLPWIIYFLALIGFILGVLLTAVRT